MIDRHWDGIAAYCKPENKVALGFVEGLNNKIRVIQRRAYLRPARRGISQTENPHYQLAGTTKNRSNPSTRNAKTLKMKGPQRKLSAKAPESSLTQVKWACFARSAAAPTARAPPASGFLGARAGWTPTGAARIDNAALAPRANCRSISATAVLAPSCSGQA
jgi:hypothetical protein